MSKAETSAPGSRTRPVPTLSSRGVALARFAFLLTAIGSGMLWTWYVLAFLGSASAGHLSGSEVAAAVVFLLATALTVAGSLTMLVIHRSPETLPRARQVARFTIVSLVVSMGFSVFGLGLNWSLLIYGYQFAFLIAFQSITDPELDRSEHFHSPWRNATEKRRGYIPLNFFNLFWVFMVASVLGLIIEVIFHAFVFGGYEDRAGLVWGPFSPIYGFGAAFMTIALNRFWNRSPYLIFLIAGAVGAAFEWWVSFFLQTAFGVVAWDYSGTFLNIQGRTNFAAFCAWGFLGMVWVKFLLPDVLRIVDAIPLKLRTALTVGVALFMLADSLVTLVALDCWYQRDAGRPQTSVVQQYMAVHFNDEFMTNRFQSMTMNPDQAGRLDA